MQSEKATPAQQALLVTLTKRGFAAMREAMESEQPPLSVGIAAQIFIGACMALAASTLKQIHPMSERGKLMTIAIDHLARGAGFNVEGLNDGVLAIGSTTAATKAAVDLSAVLDAPDAPDFERDADGAGGTLRVRTSVLAGVGRVSVVTKTGLHALMCQCGGDDCDSQRVFFGPTCAHADALGVSFHKPSGMLIVQCMADECRATPMAVRVAAEG